MIPMVSTTQPGSLFISCEKTNESDSCSDSIRQKYEAKSSISESKKSLDPTKNLTIYQN